MRRGTRRRGQDGRSHRGRAGRLGRQRGTLAAPGRGRGVRGGAGTPSQGTAVQPAGPRGRSAAPAVSSIHAAGRLGALDVAGAGPRAGGVGIVPRISYETVRCALKKRTDALASGAAVDFVIPMETVLDLYSRPTIRAIR